VKLRKTTPKIVGSFVAPDATVVGRVSIGANSSIWYGAIIRGDVSTITIGDNTSVGDRTMIHCSSHPREIPTVIGNNVTIGAGTILHGCKIEDGAVIGEGAQVMDGAIIEKGAMVAAGALVAQGKKVAAGTLWAGVPASLQRALSPAELTANTLLVAENTELATIHAKEQSKTWQMIEHESLEEEQVHERNQEYYRRLSPETLQQRNGEVEGHMFPGRVLDTPVSARTHPTSVSN
jgi:carbonic anhydrase/acetyltransferase-like protein (isoleucine patch superfamily)